MALCSMSLQFICSVDISVLIEFEERIQQWKNKQFEEKTYPKGDNKRYNADFKPLIQTELF